MPRKAKGGKVVAEGSYGCVVTPPPKCQHILKENQEVPKGAKTVAKLFGEHQSMVDEYRLSEEIANMDKDGRWSTPLYNSCAVQAKYLANEDRTKCDATKNLGDNDVVTYIVMEYGGPSLEMYISQNQIISLREFCFIFETCLTGIITMHRKRYIHLDIKPGNILYDSQTRKCYLIDFSLMQPINAPFYRFDNMHILSYDYLWYPPEFYVLAKASQVNQLKGIDRQEMMDRFQKVYGRHGFLTNLETSIMAAETTDFITELEKKSNYSTFESLNHSKYLSQIDIFSLGMTLKELYITCVNDKQKVTSIEDLLDSMILGNVFKRYTSIQTYDELMRIIKKLFKIPSLLPPPTSASALPMSSKPTPIPQIASMAPKTPSPKIPSRKKGPIATAFSKIFKKKS